MMKVLVILALAYLMGSIPVGYLVGLWWKGIDIRRYGSGNIGTTNAFRVLGPGPGVLVLLGDFLKGAVPVFLASQLYPVGDGKLLMVSAALLAIIGHNWSLFLGFRGGKGVATGAGVIFALTPWGFLILLSIWAAMIIITRYVSVGSLTAAVLAPIVLGLTGHSWLIGCFGLLAGLVVIYAHRANIERLRHGTEPKVGEKRGWR